MREIRRRFIVFSAFLIAAAALAGCDTSGTSPAPASSTPASTPTPPSYQYKRLGVVSLIGDKLYYENIGLMVFGNKTELFDITDWKFDELFEDKISNALKSRGIEPVDVSSHRAELRAAYPPDADLPQKFRLPKFDKVASKIIQISSENNLDGLIVLASEGYNLYPTNQYVEGMEIATRSILTGRLAEIFIVSKLYLLDGKTGKSVAAHGLTVEDRFFASTPGGYPYSRAPDAYRTKWFTEYTDADKEDLRKTFVANSEPAWDRSVAGLLGKI